MVLVLVLVTAKEVIQDMVGYPNESRESSNE